MAPIVHPGRQLKRELTVRELSANRLALDLVVRSGTRCFGAGPDSITTIVSMRARASHAPE